MMKRLARFLPFAFAAAVAALLVAPAVFADDEKPPDADTIRQQLDKIIDELEARREAAEKAKNEKVAPTGATTNAEQERRLPFVNEPGRALSDLDAQLKAIAEYEHGERQLNGDVAGGFDGDKSPIDVDGATSEPNSGSVRSSNSEPENNYKIDSAVTLTRGTYPQVFHLKTSVGVILTGKNFQEDVSSLRMSYGHYTAGGAVEIYGFAERISDSYMSIDQRWEVGGGTYIALRGGLTKAAARKLIALCYDPFFKGQVDDSAKVRSFNGWGSMTRPCRPALAGESLAPWNPLDRPAAEAARHKPTADAEAFTTKQWDPVERTVYPAVFGKGGIDLGDEGNQKAAQAFYHLRRLREDAIRSIEQRGARYEFGVALSVISEIERSTVKVLVKRDPAGGPTNFVPFPGTETDTETKGVSAGGDQVFRLSLRPTVRLRPSTHLYFEGLSYFKLRIPLWKDVDALSGERTVLKGVNNTPTTVAVREPTKDWRVDAHGEIRYILVGAETLGGEKFSVVGSYDFHYDSAPPFVLEPTLREQGIIGIDSMSGLSARKRHHVFKILLSVGWGG
jgi:hypothetical protein